MNRLAFAEATRPTPRIIFRLPLRRYSIGHELILASEENPLLAAAEDFDRLPEPIQRQAIIRAVLVCHRTWNQNEACSRWPIFWSWVLRRANFPLAIAEFRIYREQGSTCPILNAPKGKGRAFGSPEMAMLLNYSEAVYGPELAMDQPLGFLAWKYYAELERQGDCEVENVQDYQIRTECEQHQRDWEKEQAEKAAAAATKGAN